MVWYWLIFQGATHLINQALLFPENNYSVIPQPLLCILCRYLSACSSSMHYINCVYNRSLGSEMNVQVMSLSNDHRNHHHSSPIMRSTPRFATVVGSKTKETNGLTGSPRLCGHHHRLNLPFCRLQFSKNLRPLGLHVEVGCVSLQLVRCIAASIYS